MPTLTEQLYTWPDAVAPLRQTIQALDTYFLNGFVGIQGDTLDSLPRLFAGTPLQARLAESVESISQNAFMESHFVALAAARGALQGTLHDILRQHARTVLGRSEDTIRTGLALPSPQPDPLLESVRHWLMEIAITGFARLEAEAIQAFSATLSQVRENPATAQQGALLTGFWHELLEAMPIKDSADVPLTRWCDLWSLIMLKSVGSTALQSESVSANGTFYPLGLELKSHARAATLVVYGTLAHEDGDQFVRITWNSFKVSAIQGDEVWLLFPEAQPFLESLDQGKALTITNMPLLPSGDLLWSEEGSAQVGKKFKWRDIGEASFAVGKPSNKTIPMLPLERHPIQIAEPLYLSDYRVEEGALHWENGSSLRLDPFRPAIEEEILTSTSALFGFLHYDNGEWLIQPLYADDGGKVSAYVGQSGAAILKKPPKTSTVSVLRERASRLLRKKTSV